MKNNDLISKCKTFVCSSATWPKSIASPSSEMGAVLGDCMEPEQLSISTNSSHPGNWKIIIIKKLPHITQNYTCKYIKLDNKKSLCSCKAYSIHEAMSKKKNTRSHFKIQNLMKRIFIVFNNCQQDLVFVKNKATVLEQVIKTNFLLGKSSHK